MAVLGVDQRARQRAGLVAAARRRAQRLVDVGVRLEVHPLLPRPVLDVPVGVVHLVEERVERLLQHRARRAAVEEVFAAAESASLVVQRGAGGGAEDAVADAAGG